MAPIDQDCMRHFSYVANVSNLAFIMRDWVQAKGSLTCFIFLGDMVIDQRLKSALSKVMRVIESNGP